MILIKNTLIITQNPSRQMIKNGAILIEEEKISDIGRSKTLEKKYAKTAKKIIDGKNKVVLPGLINAHTHASMTLFRGYGDDLPLKQWLTEKIWPAEAKLKTKDRYQGAKIACQEMLASGTTTFNDMYWYQDGEIKAAQETGLRHFAGILLIDTGFISFGQKKLKNAYQRLKKQVSQKIKIVLAPHSIYTVPRETLIWCKKFADQNNLLLHIHLSETEEEIKNCLKDKNCRPVEYLEKINFLDKNVVAAHACWLSDKEIRILAKRKVSVAHCPTSNLKLVSGVLPLTKLLKAGVNVCLGTDSAASNNSLDMLSEMKIAALIHKWNERNPEAASAQTILDLATINGARALNEEKNIGSLEIGKQADLIFIDFDRPHLKPCFDPVSHLVYAATGGDVKIVVIGGKIFKEE